MYHTGSFIKGQSLLYNLDARLKLAAMVCLSVFILWVKSPVAMIIGIALFLAARAGGISLRTMGQAVKPLLFFIVLIFLADIFFSATDGTAPLQNSFFGISFSPAGLQKGFFVVWRFLCLILAGVLLTMTTAPSQMIAAIKYFLKPLNRLKVPADDIAVMIMLALRLMPVLLTEKERIDMARRARGYDSHRAGFIKHVKTFLLMSSKILLGVFRRADELALAMDARNYRRGGRSSFVELKFKSADYFAAIVLGISLVIFSFLNSRFG